MRKNIKKKKKNLRKEKVIKVIQNKIINKMIMNMIKKKKKF